jgi:hypothetical protein
MDAVEEEQDVQLQRASADLLTDFEHSLKPFLYRHSADGTARIRRKVRAREADRLVALVRPLNTPIPPFQVLTPFPTARAFPRTPTVARSSSGTTSAYTRGCAPRIFKDAFPVEEASHGQSPLNPTLPSDLQVIIHILQDSGRESHRQVLWC